MVKFDQWANVRLLTEDEWIYIVATVPNIPIEMDDTWWLQRDPSSTGSFLHGSACVRGNGAVGFSYSLKNLLGVRPYFEITGYAGTPGEKVSVGNLVCTVTDVETSLNELSRTHVLADDILSFMFYDDINNFFEGDLSKLLKEGS